MHTAQRLIPALLLLVLAAACGEPVSPLSTTLDFGEHYLPGTYEQTLPVSNETNGSLTIESATFSSGGSYELVTALPLVMDGGAEYPLDFTFTTTEGLFGEVEDTVTLSIARGQGEPVTAVYALRAIFLDGDLDNDGHVDTLYGGDDCQDDAATIYEGAPEICDGLDNDCDGLLGSGDGGTPDENDSDADGFLGCEDDCNDAQALIYPGAMEGCDGFDSDCDGALGSDELDFDGDGYSVCDGDCEEGVESVSPGAPLELCDGYDTDCDGLLPSNEEDVDNDGYIGCEDCDDNNPDANPGRSTEVCDGFDTDCDGDIDEDDSDTDGDGDGFSSCNGIDCDDTEPVMFPGNPELCDGLDNDCDPTTSENVDEDGDGTSACEGDCNDLDLTVYVGAPELCDLKDNDCDGFLGDGNGGNPDESDVDGDLWPVCAGDCDDDDPLNYPGNTEVCDGQDNDCDFQSDEGMDDLDNDGFAYCIDCDDGNQDVFPGNPEVCDGFDNDCDPATDEAVDGDNDGSTICMGDCDDNDPTISPAAAEMCNGVDDDCDGVLQLGEDYDSDGDGTLDCNDGNCPHWVDASHIGTNVGTQALPWQKIAQALSALDGDSCQTAWVGPGTYAQDLNWPASGDDIRIVSTVGSDFTIIQSNTNGTPVTITGGQSTATLIDGFRITGGFATVSGGGVFVQDSSVTIANCRLDNNEAEESGGGIAVENGDLILRNTLIEDNLAGVHGGGLFKSLGSVTISDSVVQSNSAVVKGGGIYVSLAALTMADSVILLNDAGTNGGGVFLSPGGATIALFGNTFDTNISGDNGGCLYVQSFEGQIYRNVFQSCFAEDHGGAVYLGSTTGVSLFYNNLTNTSEAFQGAALFTTLGATQVVNNTFFDSVANDVNYGAAVRAGGTTTLQNNLISVGTGYGLRLTSSCCPTLAYNNVFAMSAGFATSSGISGQSGNTELDPMFTLGLGDANPTNDDLSLGAGSPCIDAGNPNPAFNDPDGTLSDLGAYGGPAGNW